MTDLDSNNFAAPVSFGATARTVDGLRRQNLSHVLRLFHRFGPLSRARITQLTGLSRTAVGDLLAQLVDFQLLSEEAPARKESAGRPSATYRVNPRVISVAVNPDVRGIHIGFSRLSGELVDSALIALTAPPTPELAASLIAEAVDQRRATHPSELIVALGAALPGRVDAAGRMVTIAPYIEWFNIPLADMLEEATGLPTLLGFDAHLGLTTETMWGAARGSSHAVYIYGGPGGLGSAAMADNSLLKGGSGLAARLGHITADPLGDVCSCGEIGCLETAVRFSHYESVLGAELVSFHELGAALRATTNPKTEKLLDRHAEFLGRALRAVVLAYDPDLILLGGYFSALLEQRRTAIEAAVSRATVLSVGQPAKVEQSRFGTDLLLVGAGSLAFEPLLSNPSHLTVAAQ